MERGEAEFLAALFRRCEAARGGLRGGDRARSLSELLGAAYERSLAQAQARSRRGIFYTPGFIVDALVERTVGPLVEGASPEQVSRLCIVDPACGAGAFLLGAYSYLLSWHLRYYGRAEDGGGEIGGAAYRDAEGNLRLTLQKKREILGACIYGVDLDPRAVLVARVSLALKLLEEEGEEEGEEKGEEKEEDAPSLDRWIGEERLLTRNLMCGNALLATGAFDWTSDGAGFGRVMRPEGQGGRGGFDAVIGNPPYLRVQTLALGAPAEVELYKQRYASAAEGNYDIYVAFIERSLSLLRAGGRSGFLVPTRWWQAAYGAPLRRLLSAGKHFAEAFDFGPEQVFDDPTTYTCISLFTKAPAEALAYRRVSPAEIRRSGIEGARPRWEHALSWSDLGDGPWYPGVPKPLRPLFDRLRGEGPFLGDKAICPRVFQGLKTSLDPVYVLDLVEERGDSLLVRSRALGGSAILLERGLLKPIVKAGEMKRFAPLAPRKVVLFPYAITSEGAALLAPSEVRERYPAVWGYLRKNKRRLEERERGRMRHAAWYAYIYPKNLTLFGRPKILTADMANRMAFSRDGAGELYFLGGAGGGYGLLPARPDLAPPLLALLNSSLLEWMLRPPGLSSPFRGGWFSCEARFINRLPIRLPRAPADMRALADLSGRAVLAHQTLNAEDPDKASALREIEAAEGEIDDRVFRLYGVGDAERRAVLESVIEARRES